ncbi:leucyl aminopeptidase [Marmoricola endophyticus]|uniref:leucyl aminopeptidase n=1 Tax=Marmoricola endophyticus TaxID=2040280 RepID=UPI001E5E4AAF|nr:leucyl aminopeptidase [Marmoricola endophyticus]
MTSYTLRKASPAKTRADAVVIGVHATDGKPVPAGDGGEEVAKAFGRSFGALLARMKVTGGLGEAVRVPTGGAIASPVLVLVGLGEAGATTSETLRRAAGIAVRNLGNASSVGVALPADDVESVRAVADGLRSGSYAVQRVAPAPAKGAKSHRRAAADDGLAEVAVLSDCARQQACRQAFETALVVADLADVARGWVNTPANLLGPVELATQMADLRSEGTKARRAVEVEVVDDDELRRLGCGGILGVASGSARPARLVRLTYRPKDATRHVALVGKGITYDSGGLTIKPGSSMTTMKTDMAGSATAVAATYAVAELGLPVAVTTFAPLAENMVSGSAMRPGDVLSMYDGQTVEVQNTDAEGRLVLADALAMAAELEPDAIVEMSTLTGACVVALGERIAGLFGEDATVNGIERAAAVTGELFWRLPIPESTLDAIRTESTIADLLQHNWVRWGASSWAAGFLAQFVKGREWAHLDIAGPAYNSGAAWGHTPSGATGFGVRTVVEYVAQVADASQG